MLWLFTFLFGLVIGSFLNVLIFRLPREMRVSKGFSQCATCGHRLFARDLVPLFSYLLLRGRCRYCGERISPRYPVVELANALLYLAVASRYGWSLRAILYGAVCSCLLVVLFTDWADRIIPDELCAALGLAGAGLLLLGGPAGPSAAERVAGAFAVSLPLFLIAYLSGGRAMGGGDIKLMAALGLCLGWKLTLLTTVLGTVLGSAAVLALARTRFSLGREVPLGSFLAVGALLSVLAGDQLLGWYFGLLL